jgi:hypothetical protein
MEMSSGSPAVRATRPELVSTVRQVQLPDAPAVVHEPPPLAAEPGTRHRQRDALVGLPTAAAARVGRREAQTLGAEPGACGATRRDRGPSRSAAFSAPDRPVANQWAPARLPRSAQERARGPARGS